MTSPATRLRGGPLGVGGLTVLLLLLTYAGLAGAQSRSAEEAADADLVDAVQRFEEAAKEFEQELRAEMLGRIKRRQSFIETSYVRQSRAVEKEENALREQAIAAHLRFLARFPKHPQHSPDVMFRLGELYFEHATTVLAEAEERYRQLEELHAAGKLDELPPAPERDLTPTIEIYERLLREFPTYRLADAALYLLGYCHENMGDDDAALRAYAAYGERYPQGEQAAEVWLRIGEIHFDYGRFQRAADAYLRVLPFRDSRFYDLALYKLAWARYEAFDYDRAIVRFRELIAFYEAQGEQRSRQGAQLLKEAIDYLAASLAEDDWDGDGVKDPDAGVPRALSYLSEGKPYEGAILEAYAESLYDLHERPKYLEAVMAYQTLIQRAPNDPRNPERQARIIEIFDILRDRGRAREARAVLASRFGPGSAWASANADKPQLVARIERMVETALREQAKFHHQQAQELKLQARTTDEPALMAKAEAAYRSAAEAYARYLASYPDSPYANEMRFLRAEALYYSGDFATAAALYGEVRDDPHATDYLEYAAFSAIRAHERSIEEQIAAGRLPPDALGATGESEPEVETGTDGTAAPAIRRRSPPDPVAQWLAAIDAYLALDLKSAEASAARGKLIYRAGVVLLHYDRVPEARARFEAVVADYPDEEIATFALANIINSYRREEDWESIERWATVMEKRQIGQPGAQDALFSEIKLRKLGAQFAQAMELVEQEKYEEGAREFERLVAEQPDFEDADSALYNGALAYRNAHRFEDATRLLERIVTDDLYRSSKLREDALFLLGDSARQFFDFDRAVFWFRMLADEFPEGERASFALLKAGEIAESSGDLATARTLYALWLERHGDRKEAPAVHYRWAKVLERMGDHRGYLEGLESFVERYGETPDAIELTLRAMLALAEADRAAGNLRAARRGYRQVIRAFGRRGLLPQTPAAAVAAEAHFRRVELDFEEYRALGIEGSLRQMGRAIQEKQRRLAALEKAYLGVFEYKAFDWTLAAYFRIGHIYQLFAQALFQAPEPDLPEEELDIYRTQLEDETVRWENIAVERYKEAYAQAGRLRIVNPWVTRTLEELNKYLPNDYPMFREERRALSFEPVLTPPLEPQPDTEPPAPSIAPLLAEAKRELDGGSLSLAERALREATGLQPASTTAQCRLAELLLRTGALDEALAAVERALREAPTGRDPLRVKALLQLRRGTLAGFGARLDTLVDEHPDLLHLQELQQWTWLQSRRYQTVIDAAKELLRKSPDSVDVALHLAAAYDGLKRFELAAYILERTASDHDTAALHQARARNALARGKPAEALAFLQRAAELAPHQPEVLNNLGAMLHWAGDDETALEVLLQARAQAPAFPEVSVNLGNSLRRQRDFGGAIRAYEEALEQRPELAPAHFDLALVYLQHDIGGVDDTRRFGLAIEHFQRYKALAGPGNPADDPTERYLKEARLRLEDAQRQQDFAPPEPEPEPEPDDGADETSPEASEWDDNGQGVGAVSLVHTTDFDGAKVFAIRLSIG